MPGLFKLWWIFLNSPYREKLIPAIFYVPIISGFCNLSESSENYQKYKKMLPQIAIAIYLSKEDSLHETICFRILDREDIDNSFFSETYKTNLVKS